jgi:hypothetical protein
MCISRSHKPLSRRNWLSTLALPSLENVGTSPTEIHQAMNGASAAFILSLTRRIVVSIVGND